MEARASIVKRPCPTEGFLQRKRTKTIPEIACRRTKREWICHRGEVKWVVGHA